MNEDPKDVAMRMVSMYGRSKYTPEERASDHAFSYDSHEDGRKFWIAVLEEIYRRKEVHPDDKR
jgi:hypothetical protein